MKFFSILTVLTVLEVLSRGTALIPFNYTSPSVKLSVAGESDDITFVCTANGKEPSTLVWFKTEYQYSNSEVVIINDQERMETAEDMIISTLTIPSVQLNDRVVYSCKVNIQNVSMIASYLPQDRCPALIDEPFNPSLPNVTISVVETGIGNSSSYECPCKELYQDIVSSSTSRICGGTSLYGAIWEPVNVTRECKVSNITLKLCQAKMDNDSESFAETVADLTRDSKELKTTDILIFTTALEGLVRNATIEENVQVRDHFLTAIDNLILANPYELKEASLRLLGVLSTFADNLQMSTRSLTFNQTSFAIIVENVDSNDFMGETLSLDLGLTDDTLNQDSAINSEAINVMLGTNFDFSQLTEKNTAVVKLPQSFFEDIGLNKMARSHRLSYFVFTQSSLFQSSDGNQTNLTLASVILSVRVGGVNKSTLAKPIEVTFQVKESDERARTQCGHWDPTYTDGYGAWSMENCDLVNLIPVSTGDDAPDGFQGLENFKVAHFYQPGHLALLLDPTHGSGSPLPPAFAFALNLVSYIGLIASVLCLIFFLVTYLTTKQLRTNEHAQILINIAVSLFCLYITFLISANAAPVRVLCGISAALLQYFMLVYLGWTSVEAFYLYRNLVLVFGSINRFILKATLSTWLAPLVIVAVSVGPGYEYYYVHDSTNGTSGFCRSIKLPFWLGTILPFAAAYVFNWIMFVIIIISLCRHRVKKTFEENSKSKVKFVKQQVKIAFGLATLFGLGWGFGLAATDTKVAGLTFTFQVIFSIFVGLQGVFLFVFHGIRKQEARTQWKLWLSTFTSKSNSTAATLTTGSMTLYSKVQAATTQQYCTTSVKSEASSSMFQKDPFNNTTFSMVSQEHADNRLKLKSTECELDEAGKSEHLEIAKNDQEIKETCASECQVKAGSEWQENKVQENKNNVQEYLEIAENKNDHKETNQKGSQQNITIDKHNEQGAVSRGQLSNSPENGKNNGSSKTRSIQTEAKNSAVISISTKVRMVPTSR